MRLALILLIGMMFLGAEPIWAQTPTTSVREKPVRSVRVVRVTKDRGNIQVIYRNGTREILTGKGMAAMSDADNVTGGPKVAPDGYTVGWMSGRYLPEHPDEFACDTITLWRNRKILRRFVDFIYIRGWKFVGSRQIAVYDGARHGPGTVALYDIATGREVTSLGEPDIKPDSPQWARDLIR